MGALTSRTFFPPMKWAQTKPRIMITIDVPDLTNPKFDVKSDHLGFR